MTFCAQPNNERSRPVIGYAADSPRKALLIPKPPLVDSRGGFPRSRQG